MSRTDVGEDGNEFRLHECNLERIVISLDDEYEYNVRIYRRQKLPGRFSQLWDELRVE
ncbi:MAG: hypothetical protein J07HX64_00461 [halophilic archaeon J07HX64]|nr:MAG: hypothetical protein J07HX64_00461 [halophilic archaeon J07HX64]